MDIEETIGKLRKFKKFPFPILSVYLGSPDKRVPYPSFFLTQLHALIRQNLDAEEQKYWQKDIARIEEYLHASLDRRDSKSLAFFSSQDNLWQALKLPVPLPPICQSSNNPYFEPLEKVLEENRKYLVLLVDREKAKIFTVRLGEIEEEEDIFDNQVPQRVKAKTINLGRTDKIMRDIEYHLNEHLKLVAKIAKEFILGKNIHFIVIGSHEELLPKIKRHLPYPLDKIVLGEFVTELNIPLNQILSQSEAIASKVNLFLGK